MRKPNKKAVRFSVMVAGQAGLGKTTFLATLFDSQVNPPLVEGCEGSGRPLIFAKTDSFKVYNFGKEKSFTPHHSTCNLELYADDGVRLELEVIDTPGYSDETSPTEQYHPTPPNYSVCS